MLWLILVVFFFNLYLHLIHQPPLLCVLQVKPAAALVPKGLAPPLDPNDPFADDEKERREVEELAKKFESKYVGVFYRTPERFNTAQ